MDEEDPWNALNANAVEICAASWCERREHKDWCERDQAELDAWLIASPAHTIAYLRMDNVWNRANRLAALKLPTPDLDAPAGNRRSAMVRGTATGLAAIGVVAIALFFFLSPGPAQKTYATSIGGHKIVALADGSQVELNTDTRIRLVEDAHQRTITLDKGEAFFQIKHDAVRPLVVIANGHHVTDIGTKFLVRRDPGRLRISVLEGRVRFEAGATAAKPALLIPGDIAVATADSLSVTRRSAPELSNALGWRHGVLVFKHTTLVEAAAEFNRYNREKLVIADTATARLTIDGTFPTNNTRAFTRLAREVFGLRVANSENEVVISR
jgi:transmembrane sensor